MLLCEFGNLENVLLNAEVIKKPSIRESIIRNADRLRTNYKLIKLEVFVSGNGRYEKIKGLMPWVVEFSFEKMRCVGIKQYNLFAIYLPETNKTIVI